MKTPPIIAPLQPADHEAAARLLHASLVDWYERRLRQGERFGASAEPFRIFPDVYAALDPGEAVAARDAATGELLGVCFVHWRPTHVAFGIVATAPHAGGRGVARAMMEPALRRARAEGKPARLVSSALNLDSFSLYTRLGFVPHTLYQDLALTVPAGGMGAPPPPGAARVRPARADEARRIAEFEHAWRGVSRERDHAFFLTNTIGDWRVWVLDDERDPRGEPAGFLVASHDPRCVMLGPGVARDEVSAAALLWAALDALRGRGVVWLVPCAEAGLVRTLYAWGARNVELHIASALGAVPPAQGIAFPTFLPETA
ncbi:MAG: hypothetical protein RLZZ15_3049 [Verrucomicrobiota bacterium]